MVNNMPSDAGSKLEEATTKPVSVLIERCADVREAERLLPLLLDKAALFEGRSLYGCHILVKPNLLRAQPLACTSPEIVASICRWLMDQGARVSVADSPGFGSALGVAKAIGLQQALQKLGLHVEPMKGKVPVRLKSGDEIYLAGTALAADGIISAARLKAHSQMRLTMTCKNLYGCVPGLRKALYHTRQGSDPDHFAAMQSAILEALPPVAGCLDAVCAMHVTGPSGGRSYHLGLLGVSASPVALDEAFCSIVGRSPHDIPLQEAFARAGHPHCLASGARIIYPLLAPDMVQASDFQLPESLMHTSFRPGRLLRSCVKRLWDNLMH